MGVTPPGDELPGTVKERDGGADILEVVEALGAATGFPGRLDGGEKHADERADDGDDDEQFDEREAGPAAADVGEHWKPL